MNVGPMINGYLKNELAGSGMVVWTGREMYAAGEINEEGLVDYISRGYVQGQT
jgi:dihydroxy-acid dehydratase